MSALRRYLCWIFILIAAVCLKVGIAPVLGGVSASGYSFRKLLVSLILVACGVVYAKAWWTTFRRNATSKAWGIAASSINSLVGICLLFLESRSIRNAALVMLALGLIGMLAFVRRFNDTISAAKASETQSLPGDWTHSLINKGAEIFIFSVSMVAYFWWTAWLNVRGILAFHNAGQRLLMTLVVLMIITTVHEFGHAGAGMVCGMKLRAFFVGPCQWRMRDGRWTFKFTPKGILLAEGATGIVPGSGQMPRRNYLAMTVAGPMINLLTGGFALALCYTLPAGSSLHRCGVLALFGAWSVALALGNLLPFRTKNGYSDGATILQLIAAGAMADYHLAIAAIGSSLVTPLRPKDYDILALQRAARGMADGPQGLMLRLHAYSHSLDCGETREAAQALEAAEEVYEKSASDVPAELMTTFVFGNAFVRQDAMAAREWWERMQAKKPTRLNADYWRAECALHLVEGNLEEANEAWARSNTLAQEMPKAGAYDFGRDCCTLLRKSLDEAALAA